MLITNKYGITFTFFFFLLRKSKTLEEYIKIHGTQSPQPASWPEKVANLNLTCKTI